ncbi:unnamed protein product [Acanthoscelides obtectus]|uniref:Major facilitator superfamily (MFS) profile domain-containing protein n=3 Tax=Acanthoscelides obtectus TaxID=200917 RepID=A0A9P0PGA1_ACAOB|nr:unnamed protein product [Acanthoscelides obtectus]CAK1662963.1 Monocarboxylate transporter 12 [Acanthoscelides obtectus]
MSGGHGGTSRPRDEEEESDSPAPPDGGWGWMVVFGSFMIHVITDGVTYSFGIFYDEFLDYFKEGKGPTSWILSILVGVTLCSGPVSSYFVNRWGCRAVTIAGSILASACLVMSYWAQNVITLCLTIGIGAGMGFGLIYLPAIVSVTMYFEKKRSLATGIAVCGSGFGTFIFAPIISRLLTEYGWRGSILIIAGVVLECILFGALFKPLENDKKEDSEKETKLKPTEAKIDIHVSDHDLQFKPMNGTMNGNHQPLSINSPGNGSMHRPHSMGHFSLPRGVQRPQDSNMQVGSEQGSQQGKQPGDAARLALSQPMLTADHHYAHHHHRHHNWGSQSWRKHGGPIDRVDVFYQGSLMNIPAYRSRQNLGKSEDDPFMQRRHSTYSYKRRHHHDSESGESRKVCGLIPCSDEIQEMLDFSLFKDLVFILFSMSNLLTSIGFNIPYVYMVPKAKELGMTVERAGVLISVMGGANTIGRIILGYLSDKPWINRLYVYNASLTLCGIAIFMSAFCSSFYALAIASAVFGFFIGAYVGLTSVILVDLLGLDRLTNAFGLLLLFQGVASLIGPPIAGSLYDWTLSYNPGFCLAGITISLSGLILFFIPNVQRWQERRLQLADVGATDI